MQHPVAHVDQRYQTPPRQIRKDSFMSPPPRPERSSEKKPRAVVSPTTLEYEEWCNGACSQSAQHFINSNQCEALCLRSSVDDDYCNGLCGQNAQHFMNSNQCKPFRDSKVFRIYKKYCILNKVD